MELFVRILFIGRPPRPSWRLPEQLEITVLGQDLEPSEWYRTLPVEDVTDLEQGLAALVRAGYTSFDAMYCDYEHALVTAAALAGIFGARIPADPTQAILGREKLLQKQLMRATGMEVALAEEIPPVARPSYRPSFGYPAIVKPALGSGSRGVHRVDDDDELRAVLSGIPDGEPFVCERFVVGRECHIDAVVVDSRPVFLSVGFYSVNIIDVDEVNTTGGAIIPYPGNQDIYERAEKLVRQTVDALRYRRGVMHLEAFDTDTGLVFSETGLRRAGGKMPEAVSLAAGVDFRELACLASLGFLPPQRIPAPPQAAGWALALAGPGLLTGLPADSVFAALPSVDTVHMRHDLVGQWIGAPRSKYDAIGHLLFVADTVDTINTDIRRATDIYRHHLRCVADGGQS